MKKFLMTKVIEKLLSTTIMKEIPGINSVVVLDKKGVPYMQTEGVNFDILHKFPFLDERKVRSNDIQTISRKYGVHFRLFRYKQPETFWFHKSSPSLEHMVSQSTTDIST